MLPLLASAALAASLALPAGAKAEEWGEAAAAAGLTLAAPGAPAEVVCVATRAGWELRVAGVDGRVRVETVPAPRDDVERERVTRVAASLLATVEAAGGAAPTAPTVPTAPPPSSDPWDPAAVPVTIAAAPAGEAPKVRPFVAASGAVLVRDGFATTGGGTVGAGVAVGDTLWANAAVDLAGEREVVDTPGTVRATDLRLEATWMGRERVGLAVALGGGASIRTWSEGDAVRHRSVVPVLTGDAGVGVRLGGAIVATLAVRVAADVRPTEVTVGDTTWALSPWQLGAGLGVRVRIP
jgi:hypothetical protein